MRFPYREADILRLANDIAAGLAAHSKVGARRAAPDYPLILSNTAIPFVLSGFNSTDFS
jgi:hypothetical protein